PGLLILGQYETPISQLKVSPIASNPPRFAQGILTNTGIASDLGIEGRGFFVVRDTNSNALYATRAGTFYVDADRYLVNYAGFRVQGYDSPVLSSMGDMRIDKEGAPAISDPAAVLLSYGISRSGKISAALSDGTYFVRGQILLADC